MTRPTVFRHALARGEAREKVCHAGERREDEACHAGERRDEPCHAANTGLTCGAAVSDLTRLAPQLADGQRSADTGPYLTDGAAREFLPVRRGDQMFSQTVSQSPGANFTGCRSSGNLHTEASLRPTARR